MEELQKQVLVRKAVGGRGGRGVGVAGGQHERAGGGVGES